MWARARAIAVGAFEDLSRSWRTLAIADLAYKAAGFAVLTPLTALLLRWLLSRTGARAVADADIARFFFTTPSGLIALIGGGVLITAIAILELSCLMAITAANANARTALVFAFQHTGKILRLTFHMIIRVIAALIPLLGAVGIIYASLLRDHDINYYLARKPPQFILAVFLAGMVVVAFAALAVRTVASWALSVPLVLFEEVAPRNALRLSAERSRGTRGLIIAVLGLWAALAIALAAAAGALVEVIARSVGPHAAGSLALLIGFITLITILWLAAGIAVAVFNVSLFSLLIVRLWQAAEGRQPAGGRLMNVSTLPASIRWTAVAGVLLFAAGSAMLAFFISRRDERILVIAHRGASADAPENTLAAFRAAVAQRADFVELDVQESADGIVLVAHDQDLMKIGGSPMKIWEHTAAELRTVDIGKGEHVPTLAEALEVCRGSASHVLIELKDYGHDQQLEQRVAQVVEGSGMANACAFMSLNHGMVRRMKALRPGWRVGALIAKSFGDPTAFDGDFLAIEARMLTPSLVRRAHRVRKDVYVWTVNDAAWMLAAASRGSDGIITNYPSMARDVLQKRASMSDAQRLLVAVLIRAGARPDALEAEEALRP